MGTRRRLTLLLITSTLAGFAVVAAFVVSESGFDPSYIFDVQTATIAAIFLGGFGVPLLLVLSRTVRNEIARSIIYSSAAGLAGMAGFVYCDVAFTFFDIFDSLKLNIVAGFLIVFASALLFVSTKPLLKRLYSARTDRQREASQTAAWNIQRISESKREAEAAIREAKQGTAQPPRQNVEIQLKWARKAREKASLDFADDPVALGEALDRIDDEIRTLEQQVGSSRDVTPADLQSINLAIARYPKNAALYVLRGQVYLVIQKDTYRAIENLRQALVYLPCYAEAHESLGMAYEIRKEYETARKHFREAIRLDPDLSRSRVALERISKL